MRFLEDDQAITFLRNIKFIVCLTRSDADMIHLHYPQVNTIVCPYFGVGMDYDTSKKESNKILVGNSAGFCWDYISLFPLIQDKQVPITFMIPYGGYDDVIQFFQAEAKKTFPNVCLWTDIVDIEQYKRRIDNYKVYICPAKRQTGLGAIYHSLSQGLKVYIDGVNYEWLSQIGCKVHHINELQNQTTEDILAYSDSDRQHNMNILRQFFDIKKQEQQWQAILKDILP